MLALKKDMKMASKVGTMRNGENIYIRDGSYSIEKDNRYLVEPSMAEREEIEEIMKNKQGKFWK